MITKDQLLTVISKKTKKQEKANKMEAERLIERCSQELLEGNLLIHPVPSSNDVYNLVKKAFERQGISVKKEDSEVRSKNKGKSYTKTHSKYRFSLIEDQ